MSEVNSGVVELSGFVSSPDEKAKAAEVARSINGVKDVRNNISLKRTLTLSAAECSNSGGWRSSPAISFCLNHPASA